MKTLGLHQESACLLPAGAPQRGAGERTHELERARALARCSLYFGVCGINARTLEVNVELSIRFWGVRGSIASPGPDTVATGGNTSTVEIRFGETAIALDAGTGIRGLGQRWATEGVEQSTLLLSHLHWDHIQGLPFFAPAWQPGHRMTIAGAGGVLGLKAALEAQMQPPHFPVRIADMKAALDFRELADGDRFSVGGLDVRCAALNHPGGVLGYRIEGGGRTVVYATDTEHYSCPDPKLRALAKGADVLIYDAMYTPEEYAGQAGPPRTGWGHSTWKAGVAMAHTAGVSKLVLFHHDPTRDDTGVREIERAAAAERPGTIAAREGLEISLPAKPQQVAA